MIRDAKAAIVCYAVNDAASWEKLKFWVNELRKVEDGCKIYICATKVDLLEGNNKNRKVDYHDTTDYCNDIDAKLFETSSKQGTNIYQMFEEIAKDCLNDYDSECLPDRDSIYIKPSDNKTSKCCSRH